VSEREVGKTERKNKDRGKNREVLRKEKERERDREGLRS